MNYNPKVVSFERSPSYVHHRALVNRRENNPLDALELMRHAVERSPENREYRLDLAEMYCELGCHRQSNRLLLDMLAESDAPPECYFGLALNKVGLDDFEGARRLLRLYRRFEPRGAHAQTAAQLVQELNLVEMVNRPISRKALRAMRVADRACDALMAGANLRAKQLYERSLAFLSEQYKMRAMYAMSLMLCGEDEAALREAARAAAGFPPSVQALCIASQVFAALDQGERARKLLLRAMAERPAGGDLRVLTCTLSELEMHEEAAECARLALQEQPYERRLLHIRAVALHFLGTPDSQVARFWQRILRIDPDDTVAQFYLEACRKGMLSEYELGYPYEVPDGECRRRMQWLSERMEGGLEGARVQWKSDLAFRQMILWAAMSDREELQRLGATVIAAVEDPQAESSIRALLFNRDIEDDLRLHVMSLLRLRGANLREVFPAEASEVEAELPEGEMLMRDFFVGERQLLRYAAEMLEADYGVSALSELVLIWAYYRKFRGTRFDPLTRSESVSAALAYVYLKQHDMKAEPEEIAGRFDCSLRRMSYYANRISAVLERSEGMTKDEDP